MIDKSFLDWPFFEERHRVLAAAVELWARENVGGLVSHHDIDGSCRRLVEAMGQTGILKHAIPAAYGGESETLDVRSLCIVRETLARFDGLADFAFAMQGLGTGSISLYGSDEVKAHYLPPVGRGEKIAAFALSEPEAGSDVAALATTAEPDGPGHVVINGEKTWISNGGIADHYVVFARTGEAPGARGLTAFIVDADTPGLTVKERIETIAPHPLATLSFKNVRVPVSHRLGNPGEGFKVAMATLDIFRSTVGAAALGFARAALDETICHTMTRKLFGAPLSDLQMTQGTLADMVAKVDAASLLVYRAAWTKDQGAERVTREAALAKLVATENAQEVIDSAVQLHGGKGVTIGSKPEALYREIRALRIYEGASEIQKVVIARQAVADHAARKAKKAAAK
ncbi:acyl-CoA dehydrogenase family protein [Rhizobiales bacterium]|uniref:acyl-CoA dehydrogenase family protein n=1 Tax=Hongsoonwoonella zoysiae TaxID=2821844 RepID=UPI001560ED54|nr:acyl-CoA dehydrogenase family protein [Hongsoonwoonella zoysiae]NRG19335.1 acyl-CoA dehydrogenase family protein [Hongsoonwoonella zoysiae]